MPKPVLPIGIIELSPKIYRTSWMNGKKLCKAYCVKNNLHYANVSHANIPTLGQYFKRWETDFVITFLVPGLPMYSLTTVAQGGVNVHHSALPAYRGGNPLLWQILDEVDDMGITVHRLTQQVDQGEILGQVNFLRVLGKTKQELTAQSNRDFGVSLLHSVVADYLQGSLTAQLQPEQSTTDSANHIQPQALLDVMKQKQISLGGVWDVACFFGQIPMGCAPLRGWQAWFRWVPQSVKRSCAACKNSSEDNHWMLIQVGFTLHLKHPEGCVVFKPRWHWATILARLLI